MLSEGNEIISSPRKCADIFNNFFIDSIKNRSLHTDTIINSNDPIENAIGKFENHPSVLRILPEGYSDNKFFFNLISDSDIQNVINTIDSSKAYQKGNIPPQILKINVDICSMTLVYDINKCINDGLFPDNLKYADITPTFKKNERLHKHRPISILPTLSKNEKLLYHQIYKYFNNIFSKYLCGFRKGQSTQHSVIYMLEALKKALDKRLFSGILLTDLSKAFDCISHDLLIAKLRAYGFSKIALILINDYLSNRFQQTKIGDRFSMWVELIYGVMDQYWELYSLIFI